MTARLGAVTVMLVGVTVLGVPAAAAAPTSPDPTVVPCPQGRPVGPHTACRGPVVHRSGGGVGVLTVGLSVVVGIGVAVAGFLLVRRRIVLDAARPRSPTRPRRPS